MTGRIEVPIPGNGPRLAQPPERAGVGHDDAATDDADRRVLAFFDTHVGAGPA